MSSIEDEDVNYWVDYWFYDNGRNVIPKKPKVKEPLFNWIEWQDRAQPTELVEKWKAQGMFKDGICIIMGKGWRGKNADKYLNCVDADNLKAIEEILTNHKNGKTISLEEFSEK